MSKTTTLSDAGKRTAWARRDRSTWAMLRLPANIHSVVAARALTALGVPCELAGTSPNFCWTIAQGQSVFDLVLHVSSVRGWSCPVAAAALAADRDTLTALDTVWRLTRDHNALAAAASGLKKRRRPAEAEGPAPETKVLT